MSTNKTPLERFYEKIDRRNAEGCWVWTGGADKNGYGKFTVDYADLRAHRWAYAHFIGQIPDGMFVCHRCDNPPCANPEHLFLGTNADNTADRHRKGRDAKGENGGNTKLTRQQVAQIKAMLALPMKQRDVAKVFGVSHGNIAFIASGKTWRDVEAAETAPTL